VDTSEEVAVSEYLIFAGANPMVRRGCFAPKNAGYKVKDISMQYKTKTLYVEESRRGK